MTLHLKSRTAKNGVKVGKNQKNLVKNSNKVENSLSPFGDKLTWYLKKDLKKDLELIKVFNINHQDTPERINTP